MTIVKSLMNGKAAVAAVCLVGLLGASDARAAAVTFRSRDAWTAALSSPSTLNTVDFNGFTGVDRVQQGNSYTEGGVNFEAGNIVGVGPSALGFKAGAFYGSGYLSWLRGEAPNTLVIKLPSAVHAIGFDFAELEGLGDTFTITVGSQTFTRNTSTDDNDALFFGVTDTEAFTTITITDLHDQTREDNVFPTIDNLSFADPGAVTAVPEPASLLLLATGAVVLATRRRQGKRA